MTTLGNQQQRRKPAGYKVAPQNYEKLDLAANSLRTLLPRDGHHIIGWRVLEQVLPRSGYGFHVAENDELREVAGFTIPGLVVVRRDVYDGLFTGNVFSRSTVVHELCHIVLGHQVTLHRGAVLGNHEFDEDSEWQANAMTAAVLMPIEACREATSAEHLGEICGTSPTSATYRLQNLRKRGLILTQGGLF